MAQKSTLLADVHLATRAQCADHYSALHRWGFISRTQLIALIEETSKHLPCAVTIVMRTRKGMVYATLSNGAAFTVSTRAKVESATIDS